MVAYVVLFISPQMFILLLCNACVPQSFIYIIIHILEIFQPTPIISFAVELKGFLCDDDAGTAAANILLVVGFKAAE
jgi:hypothetical protein